MRIGWEVYYHKYLNTVKIDSELTHNKSYRNRFYYLVRLYLNFFQPILKLLDKTRSGAKVHKVYKTAQTPYQRLLKARVLKEAKKSRTDSNIQRVKPVMLLKQINSNLEQLWRLAERPASLGNRIMTQ